MQMQRQLAMSTEYLAKSESYCKVVRQVSFKVLDHKGQQQFDDWSLTWPLASIEVGLDHIGVELVHISNCIWFIISDLKFSYLILDLDHAHESFLAVDKA
jgi:hypothetical protein